MHVPRAQGTKPQLATDHPGDEDHEDEPTISIRPNGTPTILIGVGIWNDDRGSEQRILDLRYAHAVLSAFSDVPVKNHSRFLPNIYEQMYENKEKSVQ